MSMPVLPVPQFKALPPLSLYVHIPWCLKKCPYCDFNSHEIREQGNQALEDDYVKALIKDLETALPDIWGRRLSTIFFGGGTPSLFSANAIDTLLTAIRMLLPVEHFAEITLEANPGTFEAQKFADYRKAGINRLSIGIQSFNRQHLQALGRVHDDQEAHRAVEIAMKNFDNINLDLMYALPRQSLQEAQQDIETACALGVTHVSAYHLTLEPNTLFHRYPPKLPDDEQAAQMQEIIELTAANHHYRHYETSAFAQTGKESRHNLNYWLFGDYLGIGAGAHSKLSFPHRVVRQQRWREPMAYMTHALEGAAVSNEHEVARDALAFEFMLNALRLREGFPANLFAERTGLPPSMIEPGLQQARARGLIERDASWLRPSAHGFDFLSDLQQLFLPAR